MLQVPSNHDGRYICLMGQVDASVRHSYVEGLADGCKRPRHRQIREGSTPSGLAPQLSVRAVD